MKKPPPLAATGEGDDDKIRETSPLATPESKHQTRQHSALAPLNGIEVTLNEHAMEIRRRRKRAAADIIEIGRRLTEAKRLLGHGHWLPWLEREFAWSDRTARSFMQVYDLKLENISDLEIDISALYRLARPSTPVEVREEIIERAEAGEPITVADVAQAVERASDQLPAPIASDPPFARWDRRSRPEKLAKQWCSAALSLAQYLQFLKELQVKFAALDKARLPPELAEIVKNIGKLDLRPAIKIANTRFGLSLPRLHDLKQRSGFRNGNGGTS